MKYPTENQVAKHIGINVFALRKAHNMSQSQLCCDIEINVITLSQLERGILNVTLTILYKIATYFKVDIKDLFMD